MIVYHGTDNYSAENIIKTGIDLKRGDESVDNGQGFYTTPSRTFAARRATIATEGLKGFHDDVLKPVILQIEIDERAFDSLIVARFPECTYEWKEFVFYNRMGTHFLCDQKITSPNHNLDCKFDIVIDETADSGVVNMVSRLQYSQTWRDVDWKSTINKISKKDDDEIWDKQVSFHSRAALQCIKSMKIIEV